jgi:predicted small integral membrane protein
MVHLDAWLACGVVVSTAATDAVYVMFNAAVSSQRRVPAATWSSVWYLLSAFAVISYTKNWVYVCFAAVGSWIGAYLSMTWLKKAKGARGPEVV